MTTTSDQRLQIALKAWDVYQGLAKGMGETAWKLRSVYLALASSLVAYAYTSSSPDLYPLVSGLGILFLLMESGYRRLQAQYIHKSLAIENTIDDFIAHEPQPEFPATISTEVQTPDLEGLRDLLRLKRVSFWLPYLLMVGVPIALWCIRFQKQP